MYKHFRLSPGRELENDRKYEFKQKRGHTLLMEQEFGTKLYPEEEGFLRVIQPDYAFELRRHSPKSSWVITQFVRNPEKRLPFPDPAKEIAQWVTYPTTFSSLFDPLGIVVQEPGYKATGFSVLELGGERYIKVEFIYTPDGENQKTPSIKGYAVYNPKKYWVVKEYNVAMNWAARKDLSASTVVKMEYVESSDGFPIIKRVLQQYDSKGSKKEYHGDWEYQFDLAEAEVPNEVFTLSAYGLPEPTAMWRTRPYWLVSLTVAGLLFLVVAVLILRRKSILSS